MTRRPHLMPQGGYLGGPQVLAYLRPLMVQAMPPGDFHSVGDPFAVPRTVNPVASTLNEANLSGDPATASCVHINPFVDVQIVSFSP